MAEVQAAETPSAPFVIKISIFVVILYICKIYTLQNPLAATTIILEGKFIFCAKQFVSCFIFPQSITFLIRSSDNEQT